MESNTIKCYDIFRIFHHEYITLSYTSFKDFLDTKDLGVSIVDFENVLFEVTDKKKFFLAKIKYGFEYTIKKRVARKRC